MPGSGSVFTIDPSIMLRKPKMQIRTLAEEKAAAMPRLSVLGEVNWVGMGHIPALPLGCACGSSSLALAGAHRSSAAADPS